MSSLKERLLDDMKDAMKNKKNDPMAALRLNVIRMTRAAIKNEEINKRRELDDQEVIEVLAREVKQRKEAMKEYQRLGQDRVVEKNKKELQILNDYLPEQLTEEELRELVDKVIADVGAENIRDLGKVMKEIMPEVKGRADGKLVNLLVRERLEE
ncbi:MAG: GatB/YqeY domain-containing protein [Halanaerobium sp.]|nr:GatB/YqeY domain-containing protein [Halanaerobium sp.]